MTIFDKTFNEPSPSSPFQGEGRGEVDDSGGEATPPPTPPQGGSASSPLERGRGGVSAPSSGRKRKTLVFSIGIGVVVTFVVMMWRDIFTIKVYVE